MKDSTQHLLRSKGGGSKKAPFPSFLGGRAPSKVHACFSEGAVGNGTNFPGTKHEPARPE